MKRLIVAVVLTTVAALAIFGATAASGTKRGQVPQSASNASLVQTVNNLATRVKALERKTKKLQNAVNVLASELVANYDGDACVVGLTADELQDTWAVIDQVATAAQGKTYFGAQTALNDKGGCEGLRSPAVPRLTVSPTTIPTIAAFNPLIDWINPQ
jgi:translation initiation factor 6 (eIF-6)